jgi:hypothetical protein
VWGFESLYFLRRFHKENVPRPTPKLSVVCVFDLCSVAKAIAVLVSPSRLLVVKINCFKACFPQSMQFTSFGNPVVIDVLPQRGLAWGCPRNRTTEIPGTIMTYREDLSGKSRSTIDLAGRGMVEHQYR